MGEGQETVQVGFDANIMLLVNVMAEIRPLLMDEGLDFGNGLTLFCEEKAASREIEEFFQSVGAGQCKTLGRSEWKVPNNRIGLHVFGRYEEERRIYEFLQEDTFTPVIIICGMLPDFLRAGQNLIVLEQGVEIQQAAISQAFQGFCAYIRNNPQLLQRQIRLCKSAEFLRQGGKEPLYISLEAAAEVFCGYFRESHDETQTKEMRISLHQAISQGMGLAECYAEDMESTDFIKKAVENYIDGNSWIRIGSVEEIDGELTKAVERNEAILFDGEFYYLPEKIFRSACELFRNAISVLGVKRALLESGFLCCNDAKEGNFTVKKLLTNVFGYSFRPRFLKIRREFFVSGNSLGLEERRRECTLEISTGNHAG